MPIYTKGKIPWLKIIIVLMLVAFVIVVIGFAFPGAGTAMVDGFVGFWVGVYAFFFISPTWISVTVAVAITAGLFLLVTQRKYIFKQKVASGAVATVTPTLQGAPIQTQTFTQSPTVAQLIQPTIDQTKTEVTTSA